MAGTAVDRDEHGERREAQAADVNGAGLHPLWLATLFRNQDHVTEEQGQAVARLGLAAFGCVLFYLVALRSGDDLPFLVTALYLLGSAGYLSYLTHRPLDVALRRYLLVVLDLGMATFLTTWFSDAGLAFYPLYLWVMIGNGIRYGESAMQFATLLGLLGFTAAMAGSGFLWAWPGTYIGLMAGLVLMPRFFMVTIQRLTRANTRLQEQKAQAEFLATHDALTGLPNRAYLHLRMRQALAHARRTGREVVVVFIDLDGFKAINDSFGHATGDRLLIQVADALRNMLRAGDTVVRLGGDEFVVLIEDVDGSAGLSGIIERLFRCIGRYYTIGDYRTYVTWSCGVVTYPRDGEDGDVLLKHADTAMYAAKARGSNQYAFYDPGMSSHVAEQLVLRDELRAAIARQEFELHYQPIVDARSGRIAAAEALLRWRHPQRGLLAPGHFIEVAEHSGLIVDIGRWVIGEALTVASRWQAAVDFRVTIHVNVSPHQLRQEGFVDEVREIIARSGLPSWVLDLEMTESALLEDATRAEELLGELKDIGVAIALDDFGTGYSSLSYLRRLPVDLVKIDKSFVDAIPVDRRSCALVDAVLTLGDRLDHAVVAEGVEHERQREWLVTHGCRYLQGHLFSAAVPAEQFLGMAHTSFDTAPRRRADNVSIDVKAADV